MSSPLPTALQQEASLREVRTRLADTGTDLNLTALEQQFFVEWEVPDPDDHGVNVSPH